MQPRGVKEAVCTPARATHRDQEWYDAEIARKLQEEELLVSTFRVEFKGSGRTVCASQILIQSIVNIIEFHC